MRRAACLLATAIGLGAAFGLFGALPAPARAAGVVGDGTPGSCTFGAFFAALSGGGPVTFNCGAAPHTITFPFAVIPATGTTVDGGGLITFSGGGVSRLFVVQAGLSLTLTQLTLADGFVNGSGGAIRNQGSLLLDEVVIRASQVPTPTNGAGAILNVGGAMLVMRDSTLQDNSAFEGGAVYNEAGGHVQVENGQFISNTADGGQGGALYNRGWLTVTGSLLSGNSATSVGGGIANDSITGTVSLDDTTLNANGAASGGGLASAQGQVHVKNSQLLDNSAGVGGGGLYGGSFSSIWVTDTIVSGNTANAFGGGIWAKELSLVRVTVSGNRAHRGGGLFAEITESSLSLTDTTVSGNTAFGSGSGGGIRSGGLLRLVGATISGNSAGTGGGGGVYSSGGPLWLTNTTVSGNTGQSAGGLYLDESEAHLMQVRVISNTATTYAGGILNTSRFDTTWLTSTTVSDNTATEPGGGIYNAGPLMHLVGTTLSGNSSSAGGGLYNTGTARLVNSTLSGNTAVTGGGLDNRSSATLLNVTLAGNGATTGGALYQTGGAILFITNTVVASSPTGGNCSGGVTGASYSLASDNTCALPPATNLNGVDARLTALGAFGGPTLVHMLRTGSPAIDGVLGSVAPAVDQRGLPRPAGGGYDMGAVERQPDDSELLPWLWLPLVRR
jgi:predicted outer membrane repeat protein